MAAEILRAEEQDMEEILALQRLAYRSEAELVNDFSIQPLTQTLGELCGEFADGIVLKAVEDGMIVGSVRGREKGGTLLIGKLMVRPDRQGMGLGKRLLSAIEQVCPTCRYELFTSAASAKNIAFYQRAGYALYDSREIAPGLVMSYLQKNASGKTE